MENALLSSHLRPFAMKVGAGICWQTPGRFRLARLLGRFYHLRCIVFHNIAAALSPFTFGIKATVSPAVFENALKFITSHYVPVSLEDVLSNCEGRGLPSRAILVTFDDAYASVVEVGAPLCKRYGVPAVFFVNAAFIDNRRLAPDNLVCYVANCAGINAVNAALRAVPGRGETAVHSLPEVFGVFLPTLSLHERLIFIDALCQVGGVEENVLARRANLYLTSKQLRALESLNVEVGNHTYTHTHCRSLLHREIELEIDGNKAELESITGRRVRSFSQPYGSSRDLTGNVVEHLRRSGHEAIFLSESVANQKDADLYHLDRVSTCAENDEALFFELEVLPRLRIKRNQVYCSARKARRTGPYSNAAVPM